MRRLRHPSMRKLQAWSIGENESISRHVATCTYCADRLEPLLEASDDNIRSALLELLRVPDELPERLRVGIDERLQTQSDLTLISEFFGLPFRTVRAITAPNQGDDS